MDMIELSNTVCFFVCMLIGTYFSDPVRIPNQAQIQNDSFLYKIG